jgi:hypothetical protein
VLYIFLYLKQTYKNTIMANEKLEFNPNHFAYFVLLSDFMSRASTGIVLQYYDNESGKEIFIKDNNGFPVKKKFTPAYRTVRVPFKNKAEIEAMRKHPECFGSPNGYYRTIDGKQVQVNAVFKELNQDKDAEVIVSAAKQRAEALNQAINLIKDEDLAETIALILGISATGMSSHANLLSFAERAPQRFLEVVSSPDVEARGNVLKGIKKNILQKRGAYYTVDDVVFGVDIEECTEKYIKDEGKRHLLKRRLGLIGEDQEAEKAPTSTSKRK